VTNLTERNRKLLNSGPVRPEWHRVAALRTPRRRNMKRTILCAAAALFLSLAVSSAPANAQSLFGGGGGEDQMAQMAPMLEMMKAKMGKRRFAQMMQTMGPMMEGGGGGMMGGMGGGNMMGMMNGANMSNMMAMMGPMMNMMGPMMSMANFGGHRHHRRH
jgi:hypothetical protein